MPIDNNGKKKFEPVYEISNNVVCATLVPT